MPIKFLSVDPGFQNQGYVYGSYELSKDKGIVIIIEKHGADDVVTRTWQDKFEESKHPSEATLVHLTSNWFKKHFIDDEVQVFLYEKQYAIFSKGRAMISLRLNILATSLAGYAYHKKDAILVPISTNVYKRKLGLATGNYHSNKKSAVEYAKSLWPEDKQFTHHEADAFNQLVWWLMESYQQLYEDVKPEDIKINVTKV